MDAAMDVDFIASPSMQMFARHPIYDKILSCLAPVALTNMLSVNRGIRLATQDFSARAYNINRRLLQFVKDPISFRSLMARTRMVISGSFALQFFDRTYYPNSDLDLYLHPNRDVIDVGLCLEKEGYEFDPTSWQLPDYKDEAERVCANIDLPVDGVEDEDEFAMLYDSKSLRAVWTFQRTSPEGEVKTIQLIVARVSPLASILDFHSTVVMNVITYNAAYSLYPNATFARRAALVIKKQAPAQVALDKYSARGWRIFANPSPLNPLLADPNNRLYAPWFFLNSPRWVSDSKSWIIHLDMDGVALPTPASASSEVPDWDPVAECGWTLHLYSQQVHAKHKTIKSTILRWRYTAPNEDYVDSIIPFLVQQGKTEHRKIPADKKRADIPESWTWWDHVLPSFRELYVNRPKQATRSRRV